MARHVPHVGNAGQTWSRFRGTFQRHFSPLSIPKMDAIMMSRMHGVGVEDLLQQRVDRYKANDWHIVALVLP